MIRTSTDVTILARNTAVEASLRAYKAAEALYEGDPSETTRYGLVVAQERFLSVCRILGLV